MDKAKLKVVKDKFLTSANILRKLFRSSSYTRGVRETGYSLNGNALTNTFVNARACRDNPDRYNTQVRKPVTKAVFSFAIDFSGSMAHNYTDNTLGRLSAIESVITALYGVTHVAESVGIQSKVAFIEFDKPFGGKGDRDLGASTRCVIKDFNQKPWTDEYCLTLCNKLSPSGEDDLAEYARQAIEMVAYENAEHKVAFFMTDGINAHSHNYYASLVEIAKAKGVKLIGISFNTPLHPAMPNGVSVRSSMELATALIKELEKLF